MNLFIHRETTVIEHGPNTEPTIYVERGGPVAAHGRSEVAAQHSAELSRSASAGQLDRHVGNSQQRQAQREDAARTYAENKRGSAGYHQAQDGNTQRAARTTRRQNVDDGRLLLDQSRAVTEYDGVTQTDDDETDSFWARLFGRGGRKSEASHAVIEPVKLSPKSKRADQSERSGGNGWGNGSAGVDTQSFNDWYASQRMDNGGFNEYSGE